MVLGGDMKEFIESIFTTPVNLWTLNQELFVLAASLIILTIIVVWINIIRFIYKKIKYKCNLHEIAPKLCKQNCKECEHNLKNKSKKEKIYGKEEKRN